MLASLVKLYTVRTILAKVLLQYQNNLHKKFFSFIISNAASNEDTSLFNLGKRYKKQTVRTLTSAYSTNQRNKMQHLIENTKINASQQLWAL